MGDESPVKFPQEVIDEYTALGVDLPTLFSAGSIGNRMGIRVQEVSAERVVGDHAGGGATPQPYGSAARRRLGGASWRPWGSLGAMLHGGSSRMAVGVDLNCTHHRGARSGLVTGVATALHRGRSTATYEIAITDDQGRRVCSARLTCMIRDMPAPGVARRDDAG
ncbi:conserved hypothetical protein [Streptomyces clavuligerus]|nr:conserved hypothetical protein [Streptomyces clavuligerus]